MGKIKGKKQNLLNFLNQLVTRTYHQCRYYCAHPALLGTDTTLVPDWISNFFSILYTFFILTVRFPFLLALGWVPLNRYENNFGISVPFVSIIIPAFNKEQSIMRSITALKLLDYPRFEVIDINDGSTAFTYSVIEQAQINYIHLRQNQGKTAALNAGIAQAKGVIIVFSCSESWLHPMALRYLIERFSSPKTSAFSGTVEIAQASNLLKNGKLLNIYSASSLSKQLNWVAVPV